MAYLRFSDSKKLIKCSVGIVSENVVSLAFEDDVVVNTSGFTLFLDEKGEYNISGNHYKNFNTVFRNDESTKEYNGYQLSNDGSIYVEPVVEELETPPVYEPTEEEIAEQKKFEEMMRLQYEIDRKKQELSETDYIIIKAYEASLVGETLSEYDYAEIHEKRQAIRNDINVLEFELKQITDQEENIYG